MSETESGFVPLETRPDRTVEIHEEENPTGEIDLADVERLEAEHAAREEQEAADGRKIAELSERLHTESEAKKDEPPPKMRHAVAAGAILGATGTVIVGGRLIKKGAQLVSGLFTSIERWADNKLKKHPILSKVVAIGALPAAVWGFIGPWTAAITAPLTGKLGHKWLGQEARKSWAEQEAGEAGEEKKQKKK